MIHQIFVWKGAFALTKQNEKEVTFAAKLTKEMGKINWREDAQKIYNFIRKEVQLEGSKQMPAKDFLIGHPIPKASLLE